jgi:hypothetical protein
MGQWRPSMIFADLQYHQPYSDVHDPLVALLRHHFQNVESGLQGDSWVWVLNDSHKVAIDTFTSMQHQVKSSEPSVLVNQVLGVLAHHYQLRVLDPPELEGHEEF